MTDLKYYIGNTVEDTVMVTPDDRAICFDTEEEAQFSSITILLPKIKKLLLSSIVFCFMMAAM